MDVQKKVILSLDPHTEILNIQFNVSTGLTLDFLEPKFRWTQGLEMLELNTSPRHESWQIWASWEFAMDLLVLSNT